MGETEKPFACDVAGCTVRFVSEDGLNNHRKRHRMMLSLKCGGDASEKNTVEQTPTPTRFLRCMDVELFQDLRSGLTPEAAQSFQVNPFEEDFRRGVQAASQGDLLIHEDHSSTQEPEEPLNTPCIPPVTADALRGPSIPILSLPSPAQKCRGTTAAVAPSVQNENEVLQEGSAAQGQKEQAPQRDTLEEREATAGSGPERCLPQTPDIIRCTRESLGSVLPKGQPSEVEKCRTPVITSVRVIQNQAPSQTAQKSVLRTVVPEIVTALQPVHSLSKAPITAAPTASVIQIPSNVQLLIVSNPTVPPILNGPPAAVVTSQAPQQDARMKLKEALSIRNQASGLPPGMYGASLPNSTSTMPPLLANGADCPCTAGRRRKKDDEIEDERKKKTREINKFAAQRSRERKKKQSELIRRERDEYKRLYEELHARYTKVMEEKAKLKQEKTIFLHTIQQLKWQLQCHENCTVTQEQKKAKSVIHQTTARKPSTETEPARPPAFLHSVIISNAPSSATSIISNTSNSAT